MKTAFTTMGLSLISLGVVFHVYVFTLESITWRIPKTWKRFGLPSQEHADITAPMALNQGFYNLFLGLGAIVGIALLGTNSTIGFTLIFFAALSMAGAGVVLFFSVKRSRRAAIIQAGPPLIGVVLVILGFVQ